MSVHHKRVHPLIGHHDKLQYCYPFAQYIHHQNHQKYKLVLGLTDYGKLK